MRVTQALSQSLLHRLQPSVPVLGALCLALAVSGCATRTTLGEKPAAAQQDSAAVTPGSGAQTTSITPLQKFMWFFSPYRPDIQQGNFISEEMLAQLKVGQTRDQVRFLLGTPLLTDIFHGERWDYPFRLAKGSGETTTSRVVVFFKDGKVERFEGGNLPTEKEYIARIAGPMPVMKKNLNAPDNQPAPKSAPLPAGTDSASPVPSR
ncbi:outer membrane protein assembly factor BamE [Oxalobacteraceae bacterium]|nr:outer membrane protein assembly factor BamE [Oxalobacteraceae bacterium]